MTGLLAVANVKYAVSVFVGWAATALIQSWVDEGKALETAGGIINALPLLGKDPFLVVNGDIWCDFDFSTLPELNTDSQAHLILVNNPAHHPEGDFALSGELIKNSGQPMYTYSGIGIYHPGFFSAQEKGAAPLAPIIREKCEQDLVSGQYHAGRWTDVGTVERLQQLEQQLGNLWLILELTMTVRFISLFSTHNGHWSFVIRQKLKTGTNA